jgi:subtilisin family serine protease
MRTSSAAVVTLVLCAVGALAAPRVPRTLDHLDGSTLDLRSARALGSGERKVSRRLRSALAARTSAGALVPAEPPRAADGRLQVYVDCSTVGPSQLAALAAAGVRVDAVRVDTGRVQATMDADALERVADFSWVRAIRSVDRPVVRAGGTTTEGDVAARADVVRAQGLDGHGVVVGVISDGIDHLGDAQASGDLPAIDVPDGGCRRGSGDEGTALLEIVHDVAPGARLLFAGPASSVEMVEAVECLVAAGADVIVDDLGFFGEPYFEDGPVAAAVRDAVAAGVSYHSSAGNEAGEHLEQDFVPTAGSTAHDFGAGTADNTDTVLVPAGGTLTCVLQWNDPFGGSANDYDMFLLDADLNVVDFSVDPQEGAQDPIEIVSIANQSATDQLANVVISRFAGEARRLELFCLGAGALEHGTTAGSIVGHPALAEVVAVAAIDVHDENLDEVEAFSSQGPARIDFPVRQTRAKPDVAAFDGVSISNAGGFPSCPPFCAFFGTSAASPHTAGVAALLLQKDPGLTPAGVQAALRQGAADIEAPGFDDVSGFGRLDALAASQAVVVPPCTGDDECSDGDPCTADECDAALGCVSRALGSVEDLECRLGQLGAPDVCAPGELDARTQELIAKRVEKVSSLIEVALGAPRPARRAAAFERIARQLAGLRARLARAVAKGSVAPACAATIERLVDDARELASLLKG